MARGASTSCTHSIPKAMWWLPAEAQTKRRVVAEGVTLDQDRASRPVQSDKVAAPRSRVHDGAAHSPRVERSWQCEVYDVERNFRGTLGQGASLGNRIFGRRCRCG